LVAAANILSQDPKKRRKLGDIGKAVEQAWQDTAQRVHQYHRVKGDGQIARRNSGVSVPPTIRVTDAFGRPVAEVDVQFKAVGGGSIDKQQVKTVRTNQRGEAIGGSWHLGQAPGSNIIEVRVQNKLVASFQAVAY
jgi:tartrate dehydratase alpha subunit/fumarate hydratase class I-like protein